MKPGDKVNIEIPKSILPEKLKEVAFIRQVIKSGTIAEIEGKDLIVIGFSRANSNWAIVKTLEGDEYEISKEYLKEVKA